MENLIQFISSSEFATPVYFWIAGAVALLLIFMPWIREKKGLGIELQYWRDKVAFKSNRILVLSIPVFITTILMAGVLSTPQVTMKSITNIYGYPVMLVVDISGSMGIGYRQSTPFGYSQQIFNSLISVRGDINYGLLMFSNDRYIARYFINKNELFRDSLENIKEIGSLATGTRISAAVTQAHQFILDNIVGGGALILISDMAIVDSEWRNLISEMNEMSMEGIKPYMITPYDADTVIKLAAKGTGYANLPGVDISQVIGFKIVAMTDTAGINEITREITSTQMLLVRQHEELLKKTLIPYFIIPAMAVFGLCLVLGETRFRKIP